MATNKRHPKAMTTKRHTYGIFFTALTFAVTASFVATASASALGLDAGSDTSTSVNGSVSAENADAEANADTATEGETTLSDNDSGISNSTGMDTGTTASVTESNDPEDGDTEDTADSETGSEASGEGQAGISGNAVVPSNGSGDEVGFGMDLLLRSNILAMMSDPVELEEGDVEAQAASESDTNFTSDFTYYVVHHDQDYDKAIYREPARLGGGNVELSGSTTGSFWFGVSAPDDDGIQSEINHQGKVLLYLETEDGWKSLEAQFDGQGELQHVNGVSPVAADEETEDAAE